MTTAFTNRTHAVRAPLGVYAPQHDSELIVAALARSGRAPGSRVADLCTGSGFVAVGAASQGAASVTAFDLCPKAVRCARTNAAAAGVDVRVHLGSWARAGEFGPFDVVTCNPPYVPHDPDMDDGLTLEDGPAAAWNAGPDGRMVLDPLCEAAPVLLADGGTLMLVHSEFANIEQSLSALRSAGLHADVVAQQRIPLGPVSLARAEWLARLGVLAPGGRDELLAVIRADRR